MQLLIIENNPILEENFTNQLSFDKKINFSYYSNINIIKEIIPKKEFDFIIVIGYNDQPIQKGKGSAIFIHLSTKKYNPTKGCIGLHLKDMKKLLSYNLRNIKII